MINNYKIYTLKIPTSIIFIGYYGYWTIIQDEHKVDQTTEFLVDI
jgi:hypothetical protein